MAAVIKTIKLDRNEVIATAQAIYEVRGTSLEKISKMLGVHVETVKKWKRKGVWKDREAELPKVLELTRQKTIEMFAKQGMPPERAVDLMIEGMEDQQVEIVNEVDDSGKSHKVAKTVFEGHKSYKTRHKFQHDYHLLTGQIGGSGKVELNNNGTGTVNVMVNLPEKK